MRCCVFLDNQQQVKVKTGLVRQHKRWHEPDGSPALVRVTSVKNGVVFYGFGRDAREGRYFIDIKSFLDLTEPEPT